MRGKNRIQALNRRIKELENNIEWWKGKYSDSQFEVTQLTATLNAQKKANLIEVTKRNKEIMDKAVQEAKQAFTDDKITQIREEEHMKSRREFLNAFAIMWGERLIGIYGHGSGALDVMNRICELVGATDEEKTILLKMDLTRQAKRNLQFHDRQLGEINRQTDFANIK
ncbi:hypothetical protein [Bifidobacterium olomucense]|uniref:Uncharacterized protein n=1 Tax=Bifidobacterium olomucense TaxID=2675324 RepID=A0A7Y0F018_9BIFI|nr:hypothetical protein [Bifidobacterium sp. DSM 109959]NMM99283.1 hypothetical protein [Bifidobacterium sp. DSM 109959]